MRSVIKAFCCTTWDTCSLIGLWLMGEWIFWRKWGLKKIIASLYLVNIISALYFSLSALKGRGKKYSTLPKLGSRISVSKNSPPATTLAVAIPEASQQPVRHGGARAWKPQAKTGVGLEGTCPLFVLASSSNIIFGSKVQESEGSYCSFPVTWLDSALPPPHLLEPKYLKGRGQDTCSLGDWRAVETDLSFTIPLRPPTSSRLMIFAPTITAYKYWL